MSVSAAIFYVLLLCHLLYLWNMDTVNTETAM